MYNKRVRVHGGRKAQGGGRERKRACYLEGVLMLVLPYCPMYRSDFSFSIRPISILSEGSVSQSS